MTDLEKFVSMLHNALMEYFYYHNNNAEVIVVFIDGVVIFHNFDVNNRQYISCEISKDYNSLAEIVREIMEE